MINGKRQIEKFLLQQFNKTFNVFHLYEYCFRKYKGSQPQICRKYSNLFTFIHLMNRRSVKQDKQQKFIKDWKDIIDNKPKFDYCPYLQELIKLLEIIEQKNTQITLFIQFLNQITHDNWKTLQSILNFRLTEFRKSIQSIFKQILVNKAPKISKSTESKLRIIISSTKNKETHYTQTLTQSDEFVNNQISEQVQEDEIKLEGPTCLKQKLKSPQQKSNQSNPYLVAPIRFFIKQKPAVVKLLSKKQVIQLRQSINERKKSNAQLPSSSSTKLSEKAISHKIKSQNYNTYHTQIYQHSDESSSHDQTDKNDMSVQKKGKSSIKRHHRSNFQDAQNLKKLLEAKQTNFKYNSIHKIEGIILPKYGRNVDQAPSRYTIQTTSNVNNSSIDAPAKKPRMNKISIIGKLEKTIKKIPIKTTKKPRGGIFITNERLKDINEIIKRVKEDKQDKSEDSRSSIEDDDSNSESDANQNEKEGIKDKRASQIIEPSSQKENKYKRRFGISTKKINSNHSIEWYAQQARQTSKLKKEGKRTSFFRSSGSNLDDKKSIAKSRYNTESHKKMKIQKQASQYLEQRDSKDYEQLAKTIVLSKKSNKKLLIEEQNTYYVDKKALVSSQEITKVLKQIHQQQKLDRQGKYQSFYDQAFKRKFEGGARAQNQQCQQKALSTFKMQETTMKKQVNQSFTKESLLFDLMLSNIKNSRNMQLQQVGLVELE